jgi:putative PEP-CTERM system histidine kinase
MTSIGLVSHGLACAGFGLLALVLAVHGRLTAARGGMALAALATAVWAAAAVLAAPPYGAVSPQVVSLLETLRTAGWVALLVFVLKDGFGLDDRPSSSFALALALGFMVALQMVLDVFVDVSPDVPLREQSVLALLFVAARLVVAICGLVLVHNLYANARDSHDLSSRLLCVGLGVLFAYDLNLHTLHFLIGLANDDLVEIRGAVDALAAPLLWLATRRDRLSRLSLSRQVAFSTVSVFVVGIYLIVMSLLAYGLRLTGGNWGELLQVVFLAAALAGAALVALSPRVRAEVRVRIARNFYSYRYDYRQEWLRFIDTIDRDADDAHPIRQRFVLAAARVLDCPGGALLEPADGGGLEISARWNWRDLPGIRVPEGAALTLWLSEGGRVLAFDELRAGLGAYRGIPMPDWAADPDMWLGVPLLRGERLTGVLLLQRSLARRELNWEDYDLLRTLGRQGASYLAEAATSAQLEEAKHFDAFNRRFAFVMHDIKNLVSQLGLTARNAERHLDKPEFRADMIATLNDSVTKMNDLLALLGRRPPTAAQAAGTQAGAPAVPAVPVAAAMAPGAAADMAAIAVAVVAAKRRAHGALTLSGADAPVPVAGEAGRLEAMLGHLVQNAIDASPPGSPITVSLEARDGDVVAIVADEGPGMSAAFVRDELFTPFSSTKPGGFGIGAHEAREIARAAGGRLDVDTAPGRGARFTVTLRRAAAAPRRDRRGVTRPMTARP